MKKFFAIVLAAIMLFSLAACGAKNAEDPNSDVPTVEQKEQVAVLDSITYEMKGSSPSKFSNIELNKNGLVSTITSPYDTINVEYDEQGNVTKCSIPDEDGKVEETTWTYENNVPISYKYVPKVSRSYRDAEVETTLNADGLPSEMIDNLILTDFDDGSKKNDFIKYIFEYDANGRIVKAEFYYHEENNLDHTEEFEYDEFGNITSVKYIGDSMGEYLRFDYSYKMVDKDSIDSIDLNAFQKFFNYRCIAGTLL